MDELDSLLNELEGPPAKKTAAPPPAAKKAAPAPAAADDLDDLLNDLAGPPAKAAAPPAAAPKKAAAPVAPADDLDSLLNDLTAAPAKAPAAAPAKQNTPSAATNGAKKPAPAPGTNLSFRLARQASSMAGSSRGVAFCSCFVFSRVLVIFHSRFSQFLLNFGFGWLLGVIFCNQRFLRVIARDPLVGCGIACFGVG